MSDPVATPPILVTEALSTVYYKGLPSQPRLIATTKPDPFETPTGPEAYSVPKELRYLGNHHLSTIWDYGLATQLCHALTTMGVNWSCLDALHIANLGEPSGPAIVWIGVESQALSFEEGRKVAMNCHMLIASHGIGDYYVEIRESHVMRLVHNRFLDPVPLSDPTFTTRDPFTATLGIPISAKNTPWAEGTGGFYLSASRNDTSVYLVTARHVVLPENMDDNKEYYRQNESKPRKEVVVLGTCAFQNKLDAIMENISGQEYSINDARRRIESVQGKDDPKSFRESERAKRDLEEGEQDLGELKTLHQEIATHWRAKEKRVFGELIWAPPITLSTQPGEYTLDLAIIKIYPGMLDTSNYRGNTINIGNKYSPREFMQKVYLHPTSPTSFKFPPTRLVKLEDQVPESALLNPPMLDANRDPCLVVFKNGAITGTTVGRANNVSSYTRNYFSGESHESREWPVIATDKHSGPFSAKGDSGSCVADACSRVGGIITGGSGAADTCDITYVTPISAIMKAIHATTQFKYAHLNPTLS